MLCEYNIYVKCVSIKTKQTQISPNVIVIKDTEALFVVGGGVGMPVDPWTR